MSFNNFSEFTPGVYVVNKDNKKWGIGQVQSLIGDILTANFENVGKKVINLKKINLEIIKNNETS